VPDKNPSRGALSWRHHKPSAMFEHRENLKLVSRKGLATQHATKWSSDDLSAKL